MLDDSVLLGWKAVSTGEELKSYQYQNRAIKVWCRFFSSLILGFENEGNTFLRNVGGCLPVGAFHNPGRLDYCINKPIINSEAKCLFTFPELLMWQSCELRVSMVPFNLTF